MAREVKFGIVVGAVDKAATTMIAGVGKAANVSSRAVTMMAQSGERSMKLLKGSVVGLNQGLELGIKAWRLLDNTLGGAVRKALEYRSVNDTVTKELDRFGNSVNVLQARFGDALLPILQGVARAMGPVIESATKWVTKNRELIGSKVLEWAMKVSSVLVSGVAQGAILVVKAWSGWKMIIGVVEAAVSKFFSMLATANGAALDGLSRLASALGMESVGDTLGDIAQSFHAFSDSAEAASARAIDGVAATSAEMSVLEGKIGTVEAALKNGIGRVGVEAQKALAASTVGATTTIEQQRAAIDVSAKHADTWHKRYMSQVEARHGAVKAMSDAQVEQIKKTEEQTAESSKMMVETGMEFGRVMGATIATIITERKSAEESILAIAATVLDTVLATAEKVIMAYAAQAAAGAASSQSMIPFVGPALAATAAATVFAMVRAYLSQVQGMAKGGVITGGIPGKDSVLIRGMPGERVLTVEQNRMYERLLGMRGNTPASGPVGMAQGGTVPRSTGGAAGMSVVIQQNNRLAPNRLQNLRLTRDIERELVQRLRRLGFRPA